MTTGSVIQPFNAVVESYNIQYPLGTKTSFGFKDMGSYYSRVWTGDDYPVTKPQYEKIYWRDPYKGKMHVYKRRLDKPTRTKVDYHPYSVDISEKHYGWFAVDRYSYGVHDSYIQRAMLDTYGLGYSIDATSEWKSNDTIALQGKLREKIAGSDFNAGVFLGESHQALNMITDSATRIYKALRKIKRGDVVGASRALGVLPPKGHSIKGNVASKWLELQYGWVPLIEDCKGAAEFLAKQLEFPLVQTYRVRKRKPLKLTQTTSSFTAWHAHGETRAQIIARLTEVDVAQLSGLLDPLSVAWELLPWSFVADWFLPIGDYLQARSLASSLTGEFVVTTKKHVNCVFEACVVVNSPPVTETLVHSGSASNSLVSMTRTVSSSLAVPLPNFKPLSKVLSWQHAANAVALVTQLGTGGRRDYNSALKPSYWAQARGNQV